MTDEQQPLEPGLYQCKFNVSGRVRELRRDGESWHWFEDDDKPRVSGKVTVVGNRTTLHHEALADEVSTVGSHDGRRPARRQPERGKD